jgi:putative ABC transport system permease protein
MNSRRTTPPISAQRLLIRFLRNDLAEEVLGDLDEKFYSTLNNKSLLRARLNYWHQVVNYLRPFALKKSLFHNLIASAMFRNYFKITLRNLVKQKLYSAINIGGLSIGLTCFIMIMLYVQHEFSYDRFYQNADRIYRVYQRQAGNVFLGSDYFAVTPAKLASILMEEFPEVSNATSLTERHALLGHEENYLLEKGILADQYFFKVFPFPFSKGNPKTALDDTKSIILTESFARKLFGSEDPMGQSLRYINSEQWMTVTGVISDPPVNSSFQFSYVVNIFSDQQYAEQVKRSHWNNNSFHTFFTLADGAGTQTFSEKFPALIKKYQDPQGYANYPFKDQYFVAKMTDAHLQTGLNFDIGVKGDRTYVYLFSVVGTIVLLLACVNYMNLAVARSINRAREVGVRKVMGAFRWQLIGQFWSESILIAFLALLIAVGLTYVLLPYFSHLIERPLALDFSGNTLLLPGLMLLVVVVGLFSGNYPALFMSALHPVQVLKGKVQGAFSGTRVQRWLIVGQFMVSIVLITGSVVIYRQLQFIRQKELGYNKDHVIVVSTRDLMKNYENIRNEWLQNPDILTMTATSHILTNITSSTIINDEEGGDKSDDLAIYDLQADYDFLNVFGIELLAGRNFSREMASDAESGYLINETAARAMGWSPEEAIGKQFTHEGTLYRGVGSRKETVIGVMKDFHMHSMHLSIQPLMVRLRKDYLRFISIKVRPENLQKTIAMIGTTVKKFSPYPVEYQFLDEHFDQLYKSDMKLGEVFGFFTGTSILIASLGLFGLAAYTTGQRTREISIRKVMGASVQNIVFLLVKDFLRPITLACLLSVPLAWYATNEWLSSFAYRIDLEWWMFGVAGLLALLLANLAISYQSVKASLANPVDSLKAE